MKSLLTVLIAVLLSPTICNCFQLQCPLGYMNLGPPQFCTDIDECGVSPSVCPPVSTCINTVGSFQCQCNPGYQPDGQICTDIDECENITTCPQQAQCSNTIGSYICDCNKGFIFKNNQCIDVDECSADAAVCPTGHKCYNSAGSFRCVYDSCASSPCPTERICVNTVTGHQCWTEDDFDFRK